MSNLSAFLSQNAIKVENIKYQASNRFLESVLDEGTNDPVIDVDTNKPLTKPVDWELCCITSEEDDVLRKSCTRQVQIPGKKNMYTPETDYTRYITKLVVRCVVFPNLNDKELQDSYKVMGAEQLVRTMLLPGEYADLAEKVQKVNGFEVSMEDKVDEAKN